MPLPYRDIRKLVYYDARSVFFLLLCCHLLLLAVSSRPSVYWRSIFFQLLYSAAATAVLFLCVFPLLRCVYWRSVFFQLLYSAAADVFFTYKKPHRHECVKFWKGPFGVLPHKVESRKHGRVNKQGNNCFKQVFICIYFTCKRYKFESRAIHLILDYDFNLCPFEYLASLKILKWGL